MKRLSYLFLLVICFLVGDVYVQAESCDLEDFERLKSLANNVLIHYEYITEGGLENTYSISVTGMTAEMYISDGRESYYLNEGSDGTLTLLYDAGDVTFSIYSVNCSDVLLRTIPIKLPTFNIFSDSDDCKRLEEYNLEVCDPWYQGNINRNEFNKIIAKYDEKEELKTSAINKRYFLIGIVGIFIFIILIAMFLIRRKRSVLE